MEWFVKAETHEGKVMTLRRGFSSKEAAEDHPVTLSLWRRVWVESVATPQASDGLPEFPWDWIASKEPSANGQFHAYVVDATGRKIAVVFGKAGEKEKIADFILGAVREKRERDAKN